MNVADILVKLLENDGNGFIFGHPGEQILPFYRSLKDSSIKHVLTRHEQGAAHAADAYARALGEYGICISTAGPGAMNLVMGVSTAFKDSVPMLVITGDNDYSTRDSDLFQSFPINSVFESISVKSFHPHDAKSAVCNMVEALIILHRFPKGPVHINLSKNVLLEEVSSGSIDIESSDLDDGNSYSIDMESSDNEGYSYSIDLEDIHLSDLGLNALNLNSSNIGYDEIDNFNVLGENALERLYDAFVFSGDDVFSQNASLDVSDFNGFSHNASLEGTDFNEFSQNLSLDIRSNIKIAIKKLQLAEKPLLILGNGIVWSKAIDKLNEFLSKTMVPVTTTYHSKGIISEGDKLNLGIVGLRGNSLSNYAYENADCILALGARLSERTIGASDFDDAFEKMIHVNIDGNCLKGNVNVCADVSYFLDCLLLAYSKDPNSFDFDENWLDEIYSNYEDLFIDGIEDAEENYNPLRPPYAIGKIVSSFEGSYFLSDAGTHTTWTTLLVKNDSFGKLLFSGGFGPMGYGLPGAIGVAFALKKKSVDDNVVVICGDGDIQMVIQELATIREYDLNVNVFIINNSQLGIIRQWEETIYGFERYEVDLKNPGFDALANAYGIDSVSVKSKEDLSLAIDKALGSNEPFLADVHVIEENIPMPKR